MMRKTKKAIRITLFVVLFLLSTIPSSALPDFSSDIRGHWAEKAIIQLAAHGFLDLNGFKPDVPITRGELVRLLVFTQTETFPAAVNIMPSFKDVPPWDPNFAAIEAAKRLGLVYGEGNGLFYPNRYVRREEVAALLLRALGTQPPADVQVPELHFTDRQRVSTWAAAAVDAAYRFGLMSGYEDGSFRPLGLTTRAEGAAMVFRMLQSLGAQYDWAGTVQTVSLNSGELVLAEGGQVRRFRLAPSLSMPEGQSPDQLTAGSFVKIITNQQGDITYLEAGNDGKAKIISLGGVTVYAETHPLFTGETSWFTWRVRDANGNWTGEMVVDGRKVAVTNGRLRFSVEVANDRKTVSLAMSESGESAVAVDLPTPQNRLSSYRHQPVPVLMYHHLVPKEKADPNSGAVITVDAFREQMTYLKQKGFTTISLAQLAGFLLNRQPLPAKPVLITFDDGYESVYQYAYPILRENHFTAVTFLIGRNVGAPTKPWGLSYLNWNQIKEMAEKGVMEFGSHTYDLHETGTISPDGRTGSILAFPRYLAEEKRIETYNEYNARVKTDILKSLAEITDQLNKPAYSLAYPFGQVSIPLQRAALDSGVRLGFVIRNQYVYPGVDPLQIPRIRIGPQDTLQSFAVKVNGGWN